MSQSYLVKSPSDFYQSFHKSYEINTSKKSIYQRLTLSKELGIGYIDRLCFFNGLEFCIGNFNLKNSVRLDYFMENNPFEINYVIKGNLKHNYENSLIDLKNESLSLLFSDEITGSLLYPSEEDIYFITIIAEDNLLDSLLKSCSSNFDIVQLKNIFRQNKGLEAKKSTLELKKLFLEISDCNYDNLSNLMRIQGKAMEIISHVFESNFQIEEQSLIYSLDKISLDALNKAKQILETETQVNITIPELSKVVGINECKLKREFKNLFNYSIHEYHKKCKMLKAYELLKYEGLTVTETASKIGYTNLSHFASNFKNYFGKTPKKIRFGM